MTVLKEVTNNGVALLLERMVTHPEEFVEGVKWGRIIQEMHKYASKEDSEALNNALRNIMLQSLTEQILEELVDPKKSDKWVSQTFTSNTPLGGQIHAQSMAQQQAQATQAHIQLHQQQLAIQAAQQRTGFGYGAGAQNLLKNIFGSSK